MIYKNVIPLALKKKEHILWEKSDYEAKALISEDKGSLKEILRAVVLEMFLKEKDAVCIGLGLLDIMLEKLQAQFPENTYITTIKPKVGFVLRPGAVIFAITDQKDIIKLIEYWGTLDGIQIIFPLDNCKENIINMVSSEDYIYKRHDFNVWNEIMSYAKVIITDTSIGDEFEIVYHKNYSKFQIMNKFNDSLSKILEELK